MVEAYKGKPFALVGVNSDGDRSALQKIIKEQGLNYRSAVGGSTSGPIAKAWNVMGWPTVYVIDQKGIIRNKFIGVDPKKLTEAVEALLNPAK
jgi:peroxiredoxin